MRPKKPNNHPGLADYAHEQIVHYAMTQYFLIKVLKNINKVGEEAVEKELKQIHRNSTFAPTNVANMS